MKNVSIIKVFECSELRRIEGRSDCLPEPNQNYPKRFPRNFSPTYLACMLRGLMAEINVCKTIRQIIYETFQVQWPVNLDECHRLSQFIFASANLYCVFYIISCNVYFTLHCVLCCTMYCTFHCAFSDCNFHVSLSFLLIALESKRC